LYAHSKECAGFHTEIFGGRGENRHGWCEWGWSGGKTWTCNVKWDLHIILFLVPYWMNLEQNNYYFNVIGIVIVNEIIWMGILPDV